VMIVMLVAFSCKHSLCARGAAWVPSQATKGSIFRVFVPVDVYVDVIMSVGHVSEILCIWIAVRIALDVAVYGDGDIDVDIE